MFRDNVLQTVLGHIERKVPDEYLVRGRGVTELSSQKQGWELGLSERIGGSRAGG